MWYRGENRAPGTGGRKRDGNDDGNEHEDRDGDQNGSGNRDENREGDGLERVPETYEVIAEVGPTNNQLPQPQDSMPQRDRRITRRARVQKREARGRTGEGRGGVKKRKKKPEKLKT